MKKWDRIEVAWVDISCDSDAVMSEDFVQRYRLCQRKTLGYYLGERVVQGVPHIFVAETDDRASATDADCERVNAIMRCVVQKIILFDRPRAKKKV